MSRYRQVFTPILYFQSNFDNCGLTSVFVESTAIFPADKHPIVVDYPAHRTDSDYASNCYFASLHAIQTRFAPPTIFCDFLDFHIYYPSRKALVIQSDFCNKSQFKLPYTMVTTSSMAFE